MKNNKGVVTVAQGHIEKGIVKYGGVIDVQLMSLIKSAGLQYTPYRFNDGRILLIMPNNLAGFLYDDKETMYEALSLTS